MLTQVTSLEVAHQVFAPGATTGSFTYAALLPQPLYNVVQLFKPVDEATAKKCTPDQGSMSDLHPYCVFLYSCIVQLLLHNANLQLTCCIF